MRTPRRIETEKGITDTLASFFSEFSPEWTEDVSEAASPSGLPHLEGEDQTDCTASEHDDSILSLVGGATAMDRKSRVLPLESDEAGVGVGREGSSGNWFCLMKRCLLATESSGELARVRTLEEAPSRLWRRVGKSEGLIEGSVSAFWWPRDSKLRALKRFYQPSSVGPCDGSNIGFSNRYLN